MGSPVRRQTMVGGSLIDDPEQAVRKALLDLRCLLICISMLERINMVGLRLLFWPSYLLDVHEMWNGRLTKRDQNLKDASVFQGLLHDLIIPAVQNTQEAALRDQGLICLGLTCMLDAVSSPAPGATCDRRQRQR